MPSFTQQETGFRGRLNPSIMLDVARFDAIFHHLKPIAGEDLQGSQVPLLREAVTLYQDDLLLGRNYLWNLTKREQLRRQMVDLLHKGMVHAGAVKQFETGIEYGHRCLQLDQACERTHRRLMRLYYALGDRTRAIQGKRELNISE